MDNGARPKSSIKAAGEPKCNPFGGPASSFGHEAVVISVVRGGRYNKFATEQRVLITH